MLPKVQKALAQFLPKIVRSKQKNPGKEGSSQDSSKQQGEPEQEQSKSESGFEKSPLHLKLVHSGPGPEVSKSPSPVSTTLIDVIQEVQNSQAALTVSNANKTYQSAGKVQKKNSRIRKGTVFDRKID
jgi:hypothetical protein